MKEKSLAGTRILLVDDHETMRMGLSLLFAKKGIEVCGEAENREQALAQLADAAPDLVLVDLSLGKESGIEVIVELKARGIRNIAYSMHEDAVNIKAAFAAGADGYVTKREMAEVLLEAIGAVICGKRYFSPVAALALAGDVIAASGRIPVETLSERELEIFRKTGEGETAPVIAESLGIAASTVGSYYSRIIDKLGLSGVKELRRHAIQYCKS